MKTKTVLIIDDEKEFVTALAERLELRGFAVQVAYDGMTALRSVAAEPPGVVLLDLMMPGMNGFELLRCLKTNWPRLPVIVITGHPNQEVAGECLRQGAFRFMSKPENFEELLAGIEASEKATSTGETVKGSETSALPTVLVVDDEEHFRDNMVKLLGLEGIAAASVASGEEALQRLAASTYDVVLLDARMPGLSGVGTLKRLRKAGCTSKVIVITGHASLDDARELLDLGAYDYLLKPVRTETVVAKIREALAENTGAKMPP